MIRVSLIPQIAGLLWLIISIHIIIDPACLSLSASKPMFREWWVTQWYRAIAAVSVQVCPGDRRPKSQLPHRACNRFNASWAPHKTQTIILFIIRELTLHMPESSTLVPGSNSDCFLACPVAEAQSTRTKPEAGVRICLPPSAIIVRERH